MDFYFTDLFIVHIGQVVKLVSAESLQEASIEDSWDSLKLSLLDRISGFELLKECWELLPGGATWDLPGGCFQ